MKADTLKAEVYSQYNPEFLRKVWAKRRRAEKLAAMASAIAQVDAETQAAVDQEQAAEPEPEPEPEMTAADFTDRPTRDIIAYVARKHGLQYRDIIGKTRRRHIVAARQEAICMAAQAKPLSLPELGRRFRRDHTTILYALRKHGVDRRISQHQEAK